MAFSFYLVLSVVVSFNCQLPESTVTWEEPQDCLDKVGLWAVYWETRLLMKMGLNTSTILLSPLPIHSTELTGRTDRVWIFMWVLRI